MRDSTPLDDAAAGLASPSPDLVGALQRLSELRDSGSLSASEFDLAKARLLEPRAKQPKISLGFALLGFLAVILTCLSLLLFAYTNGVLVLDADRNANPADATVTSVGLGVTK